MAQTTRMDLNRHARGWVYEHHRDLFERIDIVILAARPHHFEAKSGLKKHQYYRWTWNFRVHGKFRSTLKDFLLVKCGRDMSVEECFLVPFDEAISRKTAAAYESIGTKKRKVVTGWLKRYRLEPK